MKQLEEVGVAAFKDPEFFEALLDNPREALRSSGLELKEEDIVKVETMVHRHLEGVAVEDDPLMLVKLVHIHAWPAWGSNPPWPGVFISTRDKLSE